MPRCTTDTHIAFGSGACRRGAHPAAPIGRADLGRAHIGFAAIDGEVGGLIGPDDIDFVASELDSGSAAAVLLVEDLWAASFASALDRSGGVLLEGARIPQDLLDAEIVALAAS